MGSDTSGDTTGDLDWLNPRRPAVGACGRGGQGLGRRWRIAWRVAAGVLAVLVLAALVAARWVVPYYAITPGTALDVAQLISVPRGASHPHRGSVVLTDVQLVHLTALGYLYYRFDENAQIVSTEDLTGGSSSSAYDEDGVIEMATARQAAAFVALRELGYHPRAAPAGVAVVAIQPGASRALDPRRRGRYHRGRVDPGRRARAARRGGGGGVAGTLDRPHVPRVRVAAPAETLGRRRRAEELGIRLGGGGELCPGRFGARRPGRAARRTCGELPAPLPGAALRRRERALRDLDQRRRHRRFVGGALVHARADRQARPR